MPIKDKTMGLIRLRREQYPSLLSFFEDIFYKDQSKLLSKAAVILLKRIYLSENGLKANEWKKHISEIFRVEPVQPPEEETLGNICKKHLDEKVLRGKKPYQKILEKHKENISKEEKELLERVSKWHSSISSYYSVLNKLKALGIIEKREGKYFKSNNFSERLDQINFMIDSFKKEIQE